MGILNQVQVISPKLFQTESVLRGFVRYASKKTGTSTQNTSTTVKKPKHRGWKCQDGHYVTSGATLVLQRRLRFLPGLNVCFGRNGTLCALAPGRVFVTCEKFEPNWDHVWVQREYKGRESAVSYKKYFNVVPNPQHNNFVLLDQI